MKTSSHIRFAFVVALSMLLVAPSVCAAASSPLHANASAQTSKRRARKRATRRRRARPTVIKEIRPVAPAPTDNVIVTGPEAPPPPSEPPPPSDSAPKNTIVSGGILNGKAIFKPAPQYPAIAKAARASGLVTVQILVDESGQVISAKAVSGHPLLQQAAVNAARQARFSPTRLSGQPVKVSGVITYNFVLQ